MTPRVAHYAAVGERARRPLLAELRSGTRRRARHFPFGRGLCAAQCARRGRGQRLVPRFRGMRVAVRAFLLCRAVRAAARACSAAARVRVSRPRTAGRVIAGAMERSLSGRAGRRAPRTRRNCDHQVHGRNDGPAQGRVADAPCARNHVPHHRGMHAAARVTGASRRRAVHPRGGRDCLSAHGARCAPHSV